MKFLDICSGIGGFRLGFERAGQECVGFIEIDKYARKSYEAMYDTKNEWTAYDVTKVSSEEIPYADCWCFGFPCFPRGTKITTEKGLKNIEDIIAGERVLTHENRLNHFARWVNSRICKAVPKFEDYEPWIKAQASGM